MSKSEPTSPLKVVGRQRITSMNAYLTKTFVAPNKDDAMAQAQEYESTVREQWAENQDTHDTIILYHKQLKFGKRIQGIQIPEGKTGTLDLRETLAPVHFHLAFVIVIQWHYEDEEESS